MSKEKKQKNKLPFRQRMFNKFLEKPITDITIVSYEIYHNACSVYLHEVDIITYEDYCKLLKEKLDKMYGGNDLC